MRRRITRRDFIRSTSFAGAGSIGAAAGLSAIPDTESAILREPARETPVIGDFDLCVVGGSATGVFAAVAGARQGLKTALIESNGFFGGVATAGLVNIWHSLHDTEQKDRIIAGLTLETLERLRRRNAAAPGESPSSAWRLHTEELKLELDALVTEAGVVPFLHTLFVAPAGADGELEAVIIEDKSGRHAIRARFFIDATGDADLVHRMGMPCWKAEHIQPPTACAVLRGLDLVRREHPDFNIHSVIFDPRYKGALERGFAWSAPIPGRPGDTMLAGTRVFGADCSEAAQLTKAELEGRRQVRAILEILRDNFLPAGESPLVELPARIGIRDSRHIRSGHRLTESEVLEGVRFPDAVVNGSYRVDVHQDNGEGIIFRYLDGREVLARADGGGEERRWRKPRDSDPRFYQLPYRSLVPRGSKNVLAAGRMVDADEGAFGAIRVMVNCNQMGEACGTAAAVALESGKAAPDIDTATLRARLDKAGAIVI